MAKMDGAQDVVTFLKEQHQQIRQLMEQVVTTRGEARQQTWDALRRLLAVHETAEEEIVHPRARHALEHGNDIVDARLGEEHAGKEAIAALEKLDVDSAEFDSRFAQLKSDVEAHAEAEERVEFDKLADALSEESLQGMRRAVQIAEATAPTHPHPGVESAKANLLAGPFAAMIDRARDLLTGKH